MVDFADVVREGTETNLAQTVVSEVVAGTPAKYRLRNGWIATAGTALTAGDTVMAIRVDGVAAILYEPL